MRTAGLAGLLVLIFNIACHAPETWAGQPSFLSCIKQAFGQAFGKSAANPPSTSARFSSRTLQTSRVVLRPAILADEASFVSILSRPEVMEMDKLPYKNPQKEFAQTFRTNLAGPSPKTPTTYPFVKMVVDRNSGKTVGTVSGLIQDERDQKYAVLAYALIPEAWGKGIMKELLSGVISEMKATSGVSDFRAYVASTNLRSQQLLEKAGFRKVNELQSRESTPKHPDIRYLYQLRVNPHLSFGSVPPSSTMIYGSPSFAAKST
jgi:[ribosomal protein S5]-alanine N-acetyltransferase